MSAETEVNELLGLFDAPAFVRRGQDLEYAVTRLHARCRLEREERLEMVRIRLRQWASAASGPADWMGCFTAPIESLWAFSGAEEPAWGERPASLRRRRAIARDLVASLVRFNERWVRFLDGLKLDQVNLAIDQYNLYYTLEKECVLGSARLAARHFVPRARLTRETLSEMFPALPVPELAV